jgi:hypothetical protein
MLFSAKLYICKQNMLTVFNILPIRQIIAQYATSLLLFKKLTIVFFYPQSCYWKSRVSTLHGHYRAETFSNKYQAIHLEESPSQPIIILTQTTWLWYIIPTRGCILIRTKIRKQDTKIAITTSYFQGSVLSTCRSSQRSTSCGHSTT